MTVSHIIQPHSRCNFILLSLVPDRLCPLNIIGPRATPAAHTAHAHQHDKQSEEQTGCEQAHGDPSHNAVGQTQTIRDVVLTLIGAVVRRIGIVAAGVEISPATPNFT